MSFIEIILIGIALSMDAFAVSVAASMSYNNLTKKQKLSMPVAFGLFQGIMPVLGYRLGNLFSSFIEKYAGVISLVILGVIGINMIRESFSPDAQREKKTFTVKVLLIQAIATSIDAFAVGVSFAAQGARIYISSAIIAVTTFLLSLAAVAIGEMAGKKLGSKAEITGGIILIIIGIKALF